MNSGDEADYQRLNLQPTAPLAAAVKQEQHVGVTLANEMEPTPLHEMNILEGVGEGKIEVSEFSDFGQNNKVNGELYVLKHKS